jgi:ParB family chromosome partitioning protein
MAMFMASQSAAIKDAEELRLKLKAFDGALPVRLTLDPRAIRGSRWANRHEDAFSDADFQALKDDIASAGSNVQPVCVRRLAPGAPGVLNGSTPEPGAEAGYELVYGHRRHRACLELGLRVQAIVADLDDRQLFEAMERENRARKNLSAWEQGTMYRRALDEGLYPSQRKLAESLGVDISLVSKSLTLARLPDAVVRAFPSPLDIQFRWAQPLAEALQKDPDGVVSRAGQIRRAGAALGPAQVLDILVGRSAVPVLNGSTPAGGPTRQVIEGADGRQAVLQRDAQDRVTLKFKAGTLTIEAEQQLAAWVARLIG